jgi:PGF-CTERM protein
MKMMNRTIYGLGFMLALVIFTTAMLAPAISAEQLPPPPSEPSIQLAVEPSEIVADGSSTAAITATVWDGDDWIVGGFEVRFSTDLGEITESVLLNDTATATLTAGTTAGTATISAEVNVTGDIGLLTNTTTVVFTTPGGDNGGNGGSSGGNGGTTSTPTPTATTSPGITPTPTSTSTETPSPTSGATATPTPALTPGTTPGPTATPAPATPTPEEPGFGAAVAIAGLLAVAYLLMWRRDE